MESADVAHLVLHTIEVVAILFLLYWIGRL